VVVCEGEKAVDSAALIFPKSVCITSAGGCNAAAKANFKPLAGRRVMIWPDADEPGEKYAGEVARVLHALGCEVSIIDAMALAGMSPDGGTREPFAGWDAADAIAECRPFDANDDDTLGRRHGLTAFEAIEVAGRAWAFSSRASPLGKGRQDVPMDKDYTLRATPCTIRRLGSTTVTGSVDSAPEKFR
jgi:hypothetical protein